MRHTVPTFRRVREGQVIGNPSRIRLERGLREAVRQHPVDQLILPSAIAMLAGRVVEDSALESLQREAYKRMLPVLDSFVATSGMIIQPDTPLGEYLMLVTVFEAEAAAHSAMAQALNQVNANDWQNYIESSSASAN